MFVKYDLYHDWTQEQRRNKKGALFGVNGLRIRREPDPKKGFKGLLWLLDAEGLSSVYPMKLMQIS